MFSLPVTCQSSIQKAKCVIILTGRCLIHLNWSQVEPASSSGASIQQWISRWAHTVTNQTVIERMFALIVYHIDFIPSIKALQQQLDDIQVAVPGS